MYNTFKDEDLNILDFDRCSGTFSNPIHIDLNDSGFTALRTFVETKLREGRSPASIAGRIRAHETYLPSISGDSIERF